MILSEVQCNVYRSLLGCYFVILLDSSCLVLNVSVYVVSSLLVGVSSVLRPQSVLYLTACYTMSHSHL